MARFSIINSCNRKIEAKKKALAAGKRGPDTTKAYHRCGLCGRGRGYIGEFNMCRICFRELASRGQIPGVTKSSW